MKTLLKTLLLTTLAAISSLAWSAEQSPEAVAKAFFAEFINGDAAKAAQYVYVPEEVKTQGTKAEDTQKALIEVIKAEQAAQKQSQRQTARRRHPAHQNQRRLESRAAITRHQTAEAETFGGFLYISIPA